ncbi:MAG: ROK family protein, partial [Parasporobacterium sp.]|nr:ROK family protein [Parasporobacterium sp.]
MEKFIFGVDIGGTDTKIGLFTPQGELAEKISIPTDSTNHGANILKDISMAAHGIFQKRFIPERGFAGVGLAAASAVKNFDYLAPCPNIDGFGGFNVAEHLMDKFNTTARIVNDANAAALGEMWAGSGKGYSNMIFVTFGTGLGGGVILGGRLLEGVNGGGGEIGHLKIYNQSKIVCGCGRTGCAETYASATGIVRAAKNLLDAGGDVIAFEDKTGLTSVYLADLFESQKELTDVQVDPFTLMKECKNSGLQDFKDESGYNFAAKDIF